jgi:quercetin dioxygenase-like cupin family protein
MSVHDDQANRLLAETLAATLTPIEPAASVRAQWLERLRGPERFTLFGAEVARVFGVSPQDALAALRLTHDSSAWVAGQLPDSRWLTTPALREQNAVISQLPAATRLPKHRHSLREITFVLDGLLIENGAAVHRAGSLIDMPPGSEHELQVSSTEPCLVVFAKR